MIDDLQKQPGGIDLARHRTATFVSHKVGSLSRYTVLPVLSFRGTLEFLQRIIDTGSECLRAEPFHEPTPPTWREDEVSAILDAAAGRIDGSAGDMWFHLQAQGEKSVHAELVTFGIDLFDLEDEAHGEAKGFACEMDGLANAGRTLRLAALHPDTA